MLFYSIRKFDEVNLARNIADQSNWPVLRKKKLSTEKITLRLFVSRISSSSSLINNRKYLKHKHTKTNAHKLYYNRARLIFINVSIRVRLYTAQRTYITY